MSEKLSREERAEQTRKKVTDAATRLIAERGFDKVTIRQICESAGVATGTFYLYYSTKVAVLKELHHRAHKYVTDHLYAEYASALEAISVYYVRYAEMVEKDGVDHYWAISNISRDWLIKEPGFYDALFPLVQWGQHSGELVTDMSASEIATFLLIAIRGVTHDWAYHNGCYSLISYMNAYMTRIMCAFRNKP